MRGVDEVALVVQLACLTNDRGADEQRALLAVALKIDLERSKWVVTNPEPVRPWLTRYVNETYEPSEGQRVGWTTALRGRLERAEAQYDRALAEKEAQDARTRARGAAGEATHGEPGA